MIKKLISEYLKNALKLLYLLYERNFHKNQVTLNDFKKNVNIHLIKLIYNISSNEVLFKQFPTNQIILNDLEILSLKFWEYGKFWLHDYDDDCPNSVARKEGKERGGVWRNLRGGREECWLRGNGATQSARCRTPWKVFEWGLGMRALRTVASFWIGIPLSLRPRL